MSNGTQQNTPVTPQTLLGARPRWHLAVPLKVAEGFGERFQPTGFPNLGAALYKAVVDGKSVDHLLVETAQSLANWMEHVCLDPQKPCRYNGDCTGIPYVVVQETVNAAPTDLTSSLTEPHRLGSDALIGTESRRTDFFNQLNRLLSIDENRPAHLPRFAKRLFYIDPACLLHGVFLDQLDNRVRFSRLLSCSITAKHPQTVNSGGQMRGYETLKSKDGQPNSIPYSRQEFTSREITLHLTFHTDSLEDLGLDLAEQQFLAAFALYKINKLLASFPRLRTACVFDSGLSGTCNLDLTAAIQSTFTTERRGKTLGEANTDLPKPNIVEGSKGQRGFQPFVVTRAAVPIRQEPAQPQPPTQQTPGT